MKKIILFFSILYVTCQVCEAQEWLTSLDAAKRLALVQDKMLMMVWEEASTYPYPVAVQDSSGRKVIIENIFEAEFLNKWIWDHFVPVIVNESMHAELFKEIDGKRNLMYIDKFNDDSLKIMDVNGNIINTSPYYADILDLSELISKYHINTKFLKGEYLSYNNQKSFTSTYYLAERYIDASIYLNADIRQEIINLSNIYINEARVFLNTGNIKNKAAYEQKLLLLEMYQNLVLNRPRKVLRQLKRIDAADIDTINESIVAFLYLTSYRVLKDEKNASLWRSKVSLVNLKKANDIIKISR